MARNLVICCDGTNNEFGIENTNVVRLVQVLNRDQTRQLVHYDPGIGTLPEPGRWTRLGKRLSEYVDLAFATSLTRRVEGAYAYLMNYWEPGDEVFLFGFSRGAYTVRVLAAMLHSLGLLPRGGENLLPYASRIFGASRKRSNRDYWKLCASFRKTFSRAIVPGDDSREFPIRFLGVWDTVSSAGWIWDPVTYPYTAGNPGIAAIRHAVSLDERRWFFPRNPVKDAGPPQDVAEVWFPGVHSDVGGGYGDSRLWQASFQWIIGEARTAGLLIDQARYDGLTSPVPSKPIWDEQQHESLHGLWWAAEVFPKLRWNPKSGRRRPRIGLGRHRFVPEGAMLGNALLHRIRNRKSYDPPNLSPAFKERVRGLAEVPAVLPYG